MKLTDIIESVINENIAYRMALECEIANYSALAKRIKTKVDKLSGRDVPLNTIVKFLTLHKKSKNPLFEPAKALNSVSISLDYGYSKVTVKAKDLEKTNFLVAVKNDDMVDVLVKDGDESQLALIRLRMKESYSEMPGITVLVISILELFSIHVKYIYRIGHEILFLIDRKDGARALEKLAFYSSIQEE